MLKLTALLAAPLVLMGAALGPQIALVDVREDGEGGHRFVIPFPLVLAQAALVLAPGEAHVDVPDPELARVRPALTKFLMELRRIPGDVELVRVVEGDETVSVRKAGGDLKVHVRGSGEEVRATVPIAAVEKLVRRFDREEFDPADLAPVIRSLGRGELVYVRDGADEVRIWLF
jgi:hypothetical protein